MLRHIDCAWEIRGKRQVVGFFIVEGNGVQEDVSSIWLDYAKDTVDPKSTSSLPPRGQEEQKSIASCLAGVTIWQQICREFDIDWKQLPDSIDT
jgi:hypothetical protein